MTLTLTAHPHVTDRLIPVGTDAWRVIDVRGRALGHVKRDGERFLARRFHVPTASYRELGAFWSMEEACACVHTS